jgi:uncharacterized phage protein gp47/JayE
MVDTQFRSELAKRVQHSHVHKQDEDFKVTNRRDDRGSVRNRGKWSQDSVVGIVIKVRAGQLVV